MIVFKFGGASVKDADAVRNVANIMKSHTEQPLLVVVSAMGKTTNALELLAHAHYHNDTEKKFQLYKEVKAFHDNIIHDLLNDTNSTAYYDIENLFIELECLVEAKCEGSYDFNYDQIVSYGEIFSTRIVSTYLNESGIKNRWIDARNFIVTNNNFREGKVNWELTSELIEKKLTPIVNKQLVITQGFIGESKEHNTITLGREGSDYSAAIFAYGLKANHLTIWKDVDGVMNGDPKKFANTTKIDELSYEQAIEMAYYGATVIHPKTIQPLQNRHIPLYVKSFVNPIGEGTKISTSAKTNKTPIFISKSNQILLSISSKDFSFIVEDNLSSIFNTFAKYHVNINLMQNSAISFSVCIDNKGEIVETLKNELSIHYSIHANENVELLTVMHQNDESIKDVLAERTVLLEQKTRATVQYILQ
ncbi:MAG: aspartate kinase [Bacteroidia bacterium]|nr:aspartate kinase [Bacteroidia bacterium]MCZ2139831.1 aspartate kinase [Bacteroidia bacterium]